MAFYYASKAYVLSFREALANELEGSGVTVTALCPGPTESGFQAAAKLEESKLVAGKKLRTSRQVAEDGYPGDDGGKDGRGVGDVEQAGRADAAAAAETGGCGGRPPRPGSQNVLTRTSGPVRKRVAA